MRGNELSREAGAVKGLHVGSGGSRNRPFEDLAAGIIRQAAADDFEARKKRDTERKRLVSIGRRVENIKIYSCHMNWLNGKIANIAYQMKRCHDLETYLRLKAEREKYENRRKWWKHTALSCEHIYEAEKTIKEVRGFFYSQWFIQLCDADGPMLYRQIVENYKLGRRTKDAE